MQTATIKPSHKSIQAYYETLRGYGLQNVDHETALRSAFQNLLADTGRLHNWTLVPELGAKVGGKGTAKGEPTRNIRPDGTLRDTNNLARGYWEAKDTRDDLRKEIGRKVARGYSLTNTIFEDTQQAILYQGGKEVRAADLKDPQKLADLLNLFYSYTEPDIADFEQAVEEFKERVPELARGLAEIIADSHKTNARFQAAFASFFTLCQGSLNPNISRAAVDEMLVQHLLTERLIRTVFNNDDFTRKNVVAAEIEKVIAALTFRSFSRAEFLRSLDRFYIAIERAARSLTDFTEKQHFINTVYERFFQGYCVKIADTHVIVYTPQPIVDFMCASIDQVLRAEFGKSLGDPGVNILDPCTGTGNFIVNLLGRVPRPDLPRVYREQLFANEIMLLPYYIAALNIEHAYYELTGEYEPFEGLCFVDTLDLAEEAQQDFVNALSEKNTERVNRQKQTPITVIVGNPPYNFGQQNENDNNKNRKYPVIDKRIKDTYAADSAATLKAQLYDCYVKFFRWSVDRLGSRDGIVCFVSNNSFVDQIAFDGMRKHLLKDFTHIHHIDLHGNVRKNPKLSGTTHNVFGIQVGVGITVAVRKKESAEPRIRYYRVPENWKKEEKWAWLVDKGDIHKIDWTNLKANEAGLWLIPDNANEFAAFLAIGSKIAKTAQAYQPQVIFKHYCRGIMSCRDDVVYDYDANQLRKRIEGFVESYNSEVDRYKRLKNKPEHVDDFVDYSNIKWDGTLKGHLADGKYAVYDLEKVRDCLYRPFARKSLYFDRLLLNSVYLQNRFLPSANSEQENRLIVVSDLGFRAGSFSVAMVANIPELHFCATSDSHQCFPFYVYDEDGSNRRENITDWALEQFRAHYAPAAAKRPIEKWDIFYYTYGILHHPAYRTKFADNLKRELPRIPFAPDFWAFADAGRNLAHWHLDYEKVEPWPLEKQVAPDLPFSWRVEDKMRLTKDKTALRVNPSLTLTNIPPEAFQYRLGNRSALDWVIDQYQVKEDAQTGVRSDPNRPDDPEYIVRLVCQVIRVSMETVRIVAELPREIIWSPGIQ